MYLCAVFLTILKGKSQNNVIECNAMSFGNRIRQLRGEKQILQRQFAAALKIDTPIYSKIEWGGRCAIAPAKIFKVNSNEFLILWIADGIIEVIEKELAEEALMITQEYIKK
ncbi:hypothetical protein SAMD00024442_13_23 [Candidatus Symbiothrix dinenymphae]|nr:hypothetical protein SAMD00024442_13_23 [Candidatus Symbiothrix dinenymphae]